MWRRTGPKADECIKVIAENLGYFKDSQFLQLSRGWLFFFDQD
jgi:hypothetical protein